MKRIWMAVACCVWIACAMSASGQATAASANRYAIVVKDTTNPYMIRMYEGFCDAAAELGVEALLAGPGADGAPTQMQAIDELIDRGVDAIAVAANDQAALATVLAEAISKGIPVVSLDSVVNPGHRVLHIQQASPEMLGRVLIQAGAQMMNQSGQFAILSTTTAMPNQASWVQWMEYELDAYPEKYRDMALVETGYGLDEYEASVALTRDMLSRHPDLKLIIAPTVVGIRAACEVIEASGSSVKVTGLGLPSDMEDSIMKGICPWMYLWNPTDMGYLAAYTVHALADGSHAGTLGEIFTAGKLGDRVVTECEDGGTEIVLGNPKMFDSTNIMVWKDVF